MNIDSLPRQGLEFFKSFVLYPYFLGQIDALENFKNLLELDVTTFDIIFSNFFPAKLRFLHLKAFSDILITYFIMLEFW